ncbi:MAG: hypothetical protein GY884_04030 [Proteobacteria bacterium]|nr:hypothetical protein [Pseudomonadota bacterium]
MPRIPHVLLLSAPIFVVGCQADWGPSPGGFSSGGSDYVGIAPTLFIDQPHEGDVFGEGQLVTVMGRVDDADNTLDYQTFSLESDAAGELAFDVQAVGENAFTAQIALPVGAHALTFRVEDSWGNVDEVVVGVEQLDNQPPSKPTVHIVPEVPVSGQGLFLGFSSESVDPEGSDVSYSTVWSRNDVDLPEYEDLDAIPQGVVAIGEEWGVRVRATDGLLWSDEAVHAVTVEGSGPAIDVTITPDPATAQDTLTCSWEAYDPDGEQVISESAEWFVNGASAGDGSASLAGAFAIGDIVACEVTAESSQPNSANAQVDIVNAVPVVTSVTLGGAPVDESGTLTCSAEGTDADGDGLNFIYTWYVDSVATTLGTTLNGSDFDKDDEVWCTAVADDGTDTSDPAESEHTVVENSPPTAPTVTLSPDPAIAGQELLCTAGGVLDADAADSLAISYAWSVDGSLDGSVTGDTYATVDLSGGDTVACEVTVDDGTAEASSSTEVLLGERLDGTYYPYHADATLKGESDKGYFGHTVVGPGDIDGDGTDDVAIAAYGEDDETGAIYLFSGTDLSAGGNVNATDAAYYWVGVATGDALGDTQGVSGVGDVDDDGTPDLVVASHLSGADSGSERGEVYLLASSDMGSWGQGNAIDTEATLIVRGETDSDRAGEGLGSSDLDGDGVADLILSVPYEDTAASAAGLVAIFYGATTLSGTVDVSDGDVLLTGGSAADRLGLNAVGSLGDLDGDGNDDLFLGAYNADTTTADDAGHALFLDGSSIADGVAEDQAFLVLEGENEDDNFALSGEGLGDLDGDGADDVLIGARFGDVDVEDAGSVYFFHGAISGTVSAGSADASWGGVEDNGRLGWDLASGDLDGDGVLEWTTGAYNNSNGSSSAAGQAYLVLGSGYASWTTGASIEDDSQAIFYGNTANHYVGRANALVGDLNGDGFGEWVVGGEGKTRNSKTRAGFVYVLWGP